MLSKYRILVLAAISGAIPAIALGQDVTANQEFLQLERTGVATPDHGPTVAPPTSVDRKLEVRRLDLEALTHLPRIPGAAVRTLTLPSVPNSGIASSNPNSFGFDGLNHADQRFAGTGAYVNSQFSLEPPDQGFCVGNGYALEAVNTALAVYRHDNGQRVSGPTALSQFFGLAPEVIRSPTPVFGDFISDPRCHYDAQVNRFFLTLLQIGVDPSTGNLVGDSSLLIAVSQSGDPTGAWNRFRLHTTSHGAGVCPCFGDQPLIGSDANGLYISTNSFSILGGGFGGDQIYAMSKWFLAVGAAPPFVLRIGLSGGFNPDGSLDFSVHPAINTRGQEYAHFGSEYFLSAFDVTAELENKIVAWQLQNTALLNFPPGPQTRFRLQRRAIASEVYGVPPDALQRQGTRLLGSLVDPNVMEMLATNEHRMQQVTFANGHLYSAVTTGMTSPGEAGTKAGIAWFAVEIDEGDDPFIPAVQKQGYVALANGSVFFPAVGVNSAENVAIGFSLSSPTLFPSTGYVTLGNNGKTGQIHIAGAGVNSEDGFTGYPDAVFPPPPCVDLGGGKLLCEARWGDYGAAAIDEDGSIWLAGEYIGPRPRSLLANWGTFITRLRPSEGDNEQN
jgi:hypothetical protein